MSTTHIETNDDQHALGALIIDLDENTYGIIIHIATDDNKYSGTLDKIGIRKSPLDIKSGDILYRGTKETSLAINIEPNAEDEDDHLYVTIDVHWIKEKRIDTYEGRIYPI